MTTNELLIAATVISLGALSFVLGRLYQPTPAAQKEFTVKWFQIAGQVLSSPLMQLIPGFGPLAPYVADAVVTAQKIHGDTDNEAKRRLVVDAAQAASATGKVTIDPTTAVQITNAVLSSIDNVHTLIKANQSASVPPSSTPPSSH